MSGICAVWRRNNPGRMVETLTAVSSGLALAAAERVERRTDHDAGVAVSARFLTQQIYESLTLVVACDADLHNEDELAQWSGHPEETPHNVKTAALIGGLYDRFGDDFVGKLRGSFSITLWDRRNRRLLAAVDRFGINRLAYYDDGKILLVGTRIDALMKSGEIEPNINPRAIASVLNFSAVLGPETIFTSVRRLPPGSLLIATEQRTRVAKYWDMQYGVAGDTNEARLSGQLESLVEKAVAAHCKNQTMNRVGAFLSGGTDSSTVVGLMSRMQKGQVQAFSIGFQEQPFNELEYAEIAANKFQAKHYEYLVGPEDCFEALPQMIRCFDEPFGNSSAIPTYFCARLAAQNGVEKLLAGDGGDELFGGNERYLTEKIFEVYHKVPPLLRRTLIEPLLSSLPFEGGLVRRARGYVRRAKMSGIERILSFQFLATHAAAEVFQSDFVESLGDYSILEIPMHYYTQAPAREHLDRLLYTDVKITLGDSDLPKVTCMSELAGIQTTFPFLDVAVAEFSGRIPAGLKVKGFQKRYLFKKAFRNLLPIEIIEKKKHGFGIPVAIWLKSNPRLRELARDTLLSNRAFERGYFRREFIEDLFRKHESDDSTYYGDTLWTFLALELWHRQFVDEAVRVTA